MLIWHESRFDESHELLTDTNWLLISQNNTSEKKAHASATGHVAAHTTSLLTSCHVCVCVCVYKRGTVPRLFLHVFVLVQMHGCVGVCLVKIWEAKKQWRLAK